MQTALDLGEKPLTFPFGKYKDHLVEVIRQTDPEYIRWLLEQPWFRQKYATHCTFILNFGAKNENTPVHNQMQALFLENDICYKLIAATHPKLFRGLECCTLDKKMAEGWSSKKPDWEPMEKARGHLVEGAARSWHHSGEASYRVRASLPAKVIGVSVGRSPEYRGWDWVLHGRFKCATCNEPVSEVQATPDGFSNSRHVYIDPITVCVELKPTLGDDYPAVIRQIQQHGSVTGGSFLYRVLVVERYVGEGATLDQVIRICEAARITLVMLDEVQNCELV